MRCCCTLIAVMLVPAWCDDSGRLLRIDHYVRVRSTVPAIAGESTQLYVREVVRAGTLLRGGPAADRVALFIHGSGTPGTVAFDVPHHGYSWMEYLADAGFDVFSVDLTGYGRSTRPAPMNDPCNLSPAQQGLYVPQLIPARCPLSYAHHMTTLQSDWHDIGAVVDYVCALRRVDRVNLLAWSLGGPRSIGYAAQNTDRVRSVVLLAPAYNRAAGLDPVANNPDGVWAFNTQSREEFVASWDRQIGCTDRYEAAVRDAVWRTMVESDPVAATWGNGVRRAPSTSRTGWTQAMVTRTATPMLLIAAAHDAQVRPTRVRELYDDLGTKRKVYVDLACSSHFAMWEKNHLLLFQASLEWLTKGTVSGMEHGIVRLGY